MEIAERELQQYTAAMCGDNITMTLLILIMLGLLLIVLYHVSAVDTLPPVFTSSVVRSGGGGGDVSQLAVGPAAGQARSSWQLHLISPLTE